MKLTKKHIVAYIVTSLVYFIPYYLYYYNIISVYVYSGIIGIPTILIFGVAIYILLTDRTLGKKPKLLAEQLDPNGK